MGADVGLPVAFFAGLISFVSPCVLPLVPSYLVYMAGTSIDELTGEGRLSRALYVRVVSAAVVFVLGFTTVFVLLGATASAVGQLLISHLDVLSKIAGAVIIVMGLHFLGVFRLPFMHRDTRYAGEIANESLIGAYVMGLAFAFGWTPCIGPVLAVILSLAASEDTVFKGMGLLTVYSAGLGVPFILAALAARPFLAFVTRFRRHLGMVEKAMGGLLVLAGIMFITGWMTRLSYWLLETFPVLGTIG